MKDRHIPTPDPVVSLRSFEQIATSLRLPEDYFEEANLKSRYLSVGEGVSGFANHIYNQYGARILGFDQIYTHARKLFGNTPERALQVLTNNFGKGSKLVNDIGNVRNIPNISCPLVAGDAYCLPFPDGSFSGVLSNRFIEHVDAERAIKEMERCCNPAGEVRIGSGLFNVNPLANQFFPGVVSYDSSYGEITPEINNTMIRALLSLRPDTRCYVYTDGYPSRSEVTADYGMVVAGLMILRTDNQIPRIKPLIKKNQSDLIKRHRGVEIEKLYLLNPFSLATGVLGLPTFKIQEVQYNR